MRITHARVLEILAISALITLSVPATGEAHGDLGDRHASRQAKQGEVDRRWSWAAAREFRCVFLQGRAPWARRQFQAKVAPAPAGVAPPPAVGVAADPAIAVAA